MGIKEFFLNKEKRKIVAIEKDLNNNLSILGGYSMGIKEYFIEKIDIIFILISIIAIALDLLGVDIYGISLIWIAIIFCGIPIFKEAAIGLYTEFDIKADVLVTIAIISSILIGELFAAGVIAVIMAIGGYLEEYTVSKTRAGIEKLVDLTPRKGRLIENYNKSNESEREISADLIEVGDILKVVPGETVPVDGKIISGETSIDQSVLTGESIPVDKLEGDEVFSGTINLYGSFVMKAIKKGEDSSLQRLIKLVEFSNPNDAEIVKTADKWATLIVVIAFICAVLALVFTGEIIRAVTVLVVFCPCALVLATPTAIMASIGNLSKRGILVKEGITIEKLAKVDRVVFDKTGTLTYGKPTLTDVIVYDEETEEKELIHLLASLENLSEHPLAKAIVKYYMDNYDDTLLKLSDFEMIIAKGVKANLNGSNICAGNLEFFKSLGIDIPEEFIEEIVSPSLEKGATAIYIAKDSRFLGCALLSDVLRKDASDLVVQLRRLKVVSTLLTGDNKQAAEYIAKEADIVDYQYNCLPEDKISTIKKFQSLKLNVAMIGDGINDAPSLRQANVGISMGGVGSNISIEASDVCLVSDDIKYVPHLLALSRKTIRTINRGIAFALILNILATVLAMYGMIGPIEGAFVHNIGSVIVIIYSSLLLRYEYAN
ncbi:heavy metal translocating P-type ATPase [Methanobrevibacter ruminantium M1]|uniref:Heavy metal translocating P-type ATPase n=1 Tax=Methanobrevibacter ruminantium (strain ATCC 35063 / DSM 1093 / JCM 13430 / OCM 146 / M1) TaxID=634498 RepID=D3DZN3_METRM|nr:cation-translocating P-type ATPase [Methanobrevibacter ruminantium]ADC47711.1 heavy metal translocating P-type ATPase [Methanobrevibacter ruminantium M1]